MKEFSTEEKARRYDEAIEKAKKYHEECKIRGNDWFVEDIEEMFPELKESDDEKARKEITELIMLPTWQTEKEFHRRKALCAWLKKQGEKKSADIQPIEKRAHEVFPDDDDENTPLYRQAFIDSAVDYLDCGCKNPAWSKEDEQMIEDIIEAIDTDYAVSDYQEMVKWLKLLKERYTWKPSEEQLNALDTLNLHGDISYVGQQKQLIELYEQLKKL